MFIQDQETWWCVVSPTGGLWAVPALHLSFWLEGGPVWDLPLPTPLLRGQGVDVASVSYIVGRLVDARR